ncbi:MAG: hypothetical protein WC748_05395 [Legionellales bacterium]
MKYYAVGLPMVVREGKGFGTAPRSLNRDIVINESFKDKKITRIFLTREDAMKYALQFHRLGTAPKVAGGNYGQSAPVLTFEVADDKPIKTDQLIYAVDPHSLSLEFYRDTMGLKNKDPNPTFKNDQEYVEKFVNKLSEAEKKFYTKLSKDKNIITYVDIDLNINDSLTLIEAEFIEAGLRSTDPKVEHTVDLAVQPSLFDQLHNHVKRVFQ